MSPGEEGLGQEGNWSHPREEVGLGREGGMLSWCTMTTEVEFQHACSVRRGSHTAHFDGSWRRGSQGSAAIDVVILAASADRCPPGEDGLGWGIK